MQWEKLSNNLGEVTVHDLDLNTGDNDTDSNASDDDFQPDDEYQKEFDDEAKLQGQGLASGENQDDHFLDALEQYNEESVSGVEVTEIDAAHTDAAKGDEDSDSNPGVETIDDGGDERRNDGDDDYEDSESESGKESVNNVEPTPDEPIPRGLDCSIDGPAWVNGTVTTKAY